jgi:hypothetical protein
LFTLMSGALLTASSPAATHPVSAGIVAAVPLQSMKLDSASRGYEPGATCAFPSRAAAGQSGCSGCEQRCESRTRECKNGSVRSCYLAAACLCQCNLDAGGCGSSTSSLRECVQQNEKLARELDR